MRVFLAIDLNPEVRRRLEFLARELRPLATNARFLPPESVHLTLRFFGEVSREELLALTAELAPSISRRPRFHLRFGGVGVFPDRKRPRVFWVGVHQPGRELLELQSNAEAAARKAGFPPERRPYAPHLTVARFRGPEQGIDAMLRAGAVQELGATEVPEVLLFESRLSPKGASYHVLERYPLPASSAGGISGER